MSHSAKSGADVTEAAVIKCVNTATEIQMSVYTNTHLYFIAPFRVLVAVRADILIDICRRICRYIHMLIYIYI